MNRKWWRERWIKEPLALLGLIVAVVGLGPSLKSCLPDEPPCARVKEVTLAGLRLATTGKLSFDLRGIDVAGIRHLSVGEHDFEGTDLGPDGLLQLVVEPTPGGRSAFVLLEAVGGEQTQALSLRAERGELKVCVDVDNRTPCMTGPVNLVLNGTGTVELIGNGVRVASATDWSQSKAGDRLCWEEKSIDGLRWQGGELWIGAGAQ